MPGTNAAMAGRGSVGEDTGERLRNLLREPRLKFVTPFVLSKS